MAAFGAVAALLVVTALAAGAVMVPRDHGRPGGQPTTAATAQPDADSSEQPDHAEEEPVADPHPTEPDRGTADDDTGGVRTLDVEEEPDLPAIDTYPVSWSDGVTVHTEPRSSSQSVQWLPYETLVHIVCKTRGEAALTKGGRTTYWWDWIDSPVSGYLTDARVDTGGRPPDVPAC